MLAGKLIIKALEDFGILEQFCIGMFFASKKEFQESNKPIEEIVTSGKGLILQEATLSNVLDRGNLSILLRDSFKRKQGGSARCFGRCVAAVKRGEKILFPVIR